MYYFLLRQLISFFIAKVTVNECEVRVLSKKTLEEHCVEELFAKVSFLFYLFAWFFSWNAHIVQRL